jgi:hypothetical protein
MFDSTLSKYLNVKDRNTPYGNFVLLQSFFLIYYAPRHEDVWGSGGRAPCILTNEQDGRE